MKRNLIGHLNMPTRTFKGFLHSLNLFPRFICLLLALILWLALTYANTHTSEHPDSTPESELTQTV